MDPERFKAEIAARLRAEGFDAVGVTTPVAIAEAGSGLKAFLDAGRHGEMAWMAANAERRADPSALWPETRSIIVAAMNYGPDADPLPALDRHDRATISVYAQNRDYHDILKGKLKQVAGWMHAAQGADVKVFVDTAPVLEKPLAAAAGTGWQGKHTNLVSREFGSWLFLGAIFTTADLPPDDAEGDHCGSCRKCLDICPTDAFPAPYQLDARRCISYLTIEHKGTIPVEFRGAIGNRIYGCDDCLAVCPWNKFAERAREARFHARNDLESPPLETLARLGDQEFRDMFSGSPIKRIGRDRFVRNVMIAAGNSADTRLARVVRERLDDASAQVRAMAVWAASKLCGREALEGLSAQHLPGEGEGGRSRRVAARRPANRRSARLMPHLFSFGLGFSARTLADRLLADGWQVTGTCRSDQKAEELKAAGIEPLLFDASAPIEGFAGRLTPETHVLVSIPPDQDGDRVLRLHGEDLLRKASIIPWIGYLSTTGVYGDREGGWVDEASALTPSTDRGRLRLRAERQWNRASAHRGLMVHVFRLAGIYGPGRNQLARVKAGQARRIDRPGQVFSRIHVADIAQVLLASINRPNRGRAYNVCDDLAAPPQDVLSYAAELLRVCEPPLVPFEEAGLSGMAASFYAESKRVRNDRIKKELGIELTYPTYKEGLKALLDTL